MALATFLEHVQHYSTVELALKLGLITGSVHHFACQYPTQADILTCLYAFSVADAFFLAATFLSERGPTFVGSFVGLILFNTIYVRPQSRRIDQ